jgi:hypothetical protein
MASSTPLADDPEQRLAALWDQPTEARSHAGEEAVKALFSAAAHPSDRDHESRRSARHQRRTCGHVRRRPRHASRGRPVAATTGLFAAGALLTAGFVAWLTLSAPPDSPGTPAPTPSSHAADRRAASAVRAAPRPARDRRRTHVAPARAQHRSERRRAMSRARRGARASRAGRRVRARPHVRVTPPQPPTRSRRLPASPATPAEVVRLPRRSPPIAVASDAACDEFPPC